MAWLNATPIAVAEVDPAVDQSSTFHVVRPIAVTDAMLTATNVTEDDYPAWSAATSYAIGAHVISPATHRIYESLTAGNTGHDPSDVSNWLDIGPTNRWAMFDEALGTATERFDAVTVTLQAPASVDALAVLDLAATSVRVQAPGYDVTRALTSTETGASFLDLEVVAGQSITVTITGAGLVSVGTLVFGSLSPLGVTQAAPTVGINDYSQKTTDDFGNTTPVERAWAKRMTVSALVGTPSADELVRRMAAFRARPCLWIADDGFECLSIYGFYRDFSLELHEGVSTSTVTIEGLSKAAPVVDPSADLRRLEAMIAALASDDLLSAGSEKSTALTNFNALSADYHALHDRYIALGSPADAAAESDAATTAFNALSTYLGGLTPPWSVTYVDTPLDGPTWRTRWIDAYEAVATFSAAITGRKGEDGVSPPLISLTASTQTISYSKSDAIVTGDVTLTTLRQNITATPSFQIFGFDGSVLAAAQTAAQLASANPAAFATTGVDNLIIKQAWIAGAFTANGPGMRIVAAAAGVSSILSLTKVKDGADGPAGLNNATATIYQRASSAPTLPSAPSTYTFATGGLSGLNNGWSTSIPEGSSPLYASTAVASATTATATIAASAWSPARIMVKDGSSGASGTIVTMSRVAATVWAYADGSVVDWSPASGQVKVESGGVDVTATATFSAATTAGMTGAITAGGAYSVSAMTTVTGTMTITVTYAGKSYTLLFGVAKQQGGYEIVTTLPTSNLFEGRVVYLTTDDKLYRYNGSAWTTSVPAADIAGTLGDAQLAAIAASKITGQLTDAQLASIAAAKLTGQLVNAQIVSLDATKVTGQLSNSQIADLAAAKLTGQITGTQITDSGITAIKIAAGAITTAKLAAGAVTANEIAAMGFFDVPAGLEIRNNKNNTLIDGNYKNYVFQSKQTVATNPYGSFVVNGNRPMLAIRPSGINRECAVVSYTQRFSGGVPVPGSYNVSVQTYNNSDTVECFVFDMMPDTQPSTFGVQAYDANAKLVFDAQNNYMRVVDYISYTKDRTEPYVPGTKEAMVFCTPCINQEGGAGYYELSSNTAYIDQATQFAGGLLVNRYGLIEFHDTSDNGNNNAVNDTYYYPAFQIIVDVTGL